MKAVLSSLALAVCLLGLPGCAPAAATDPALPLTVAPATVEAWQQGPVRTRLQAAIAAQRNLIHLYFVQPPQVIFVERTDSPAGQRRLRTMPVHVPGADAWLVILEGDYQSIGPPAPGTPTTATPTPIAVTHGCVYVIVLAGDSSGGGYGSMAICSTQ